MNLINKINFNYDEEIPILSIIATDTVPHRR